MPSIFYSSTDSRFHILIMSLRNIEKKVLTGKRLTPEDGLLLFESDDLFTVGRLADHVARQKNRDKAYFVRNHHINPTNICVNRCKFCAFSRSMGEKGAYEMSIKDIIKKLKKQSLNTVGTEAVDTTKLRQSKRLNYGTKGFSEVHIVGGLHPEWPFDFYIEMLNKIKKTFSCRRMIYSCRLYRVIFFYFDNYSMVSSSVNSFGI